MVQALIVAAWVLIGVVVGFREVRRGHWKWLWLLGAILGPLAIPMARQAEQDESAVTPSVLGAVPEGTDRAGLKVLVGIDGSDDSVAAATSIARSLGQHLGTLMLATAVDYEAMVHHADENRDADRAQAQARLTTVANDLERLLGSRPGAVVLGGKPAAALRQYAHDEHFDLVVVARRGRGITKRLVGSCATELVSDSSVPLVIMPGDDGDQRQ